MAQLQKLGTLEEETRMKAIDDEIGRLQSEYSGLASKRPGKGGNTAAGFAGAAAGASAGAAAGSVAGPVGSFFGGLAGGIGGFFGLGGPSEEDKRQTADYEAAQARMAQIDQATRGLTGERTTLGEAAVNKRLKFAQEQEGAAQGALETQQKVLNSVIDAQLARVLQETGIGANTVRETVGAAAAERGMTRSSVAQKALNEVTASELETKGQARLQASEQQASINQKIDDVQTKLAQQRQGLETRRSLAELQSFDELGFQLDVDALNSSYQQEVANMKLQAKDEAFFNEMIGGIVGFGAKIFTGGLL